MPLNMQEKIKLKNAISALENARAELETMEDQPPDEQEAIEIFYKLRKMQMDRLIESL